LVYLFGFYIYIYIYIYIFEYCRLLSLQKLYKKKTIFNIFFLQKKKEKMSNNPNPILKLDPEIVVNQYSVDFCGMIVLQIIFWMWTLSWTKDPSQHRDESQLYRWSGFVFLFPLWAYGFLCIYKISILTKRVKNELQVEQIALISGMESSSLHIKGIPKTESEHSVENWQNSSLLWKYVWFWWGLWPIAVKMSYDDDNNYSWSFVLTPWLVYSCYLLSIAIKAGNYYGIDQRNLNIEMFKLKDQNKNDTIIDDDTDDYNINIKLTEYNNNNNDNNNNNNKIEQKINTGEIII
jgi:hypothetical protein